MQTGLKIIVILLLLFNGAGAVYGGGQLIMHPDGSSLGLSLDLPGNSPFSNYLIPGIVLFIINGLFSFFVIGTIAFRSRRAYSFIIAQGDLLATWILVQAVMIRQLTPWQVVLGCVGVTLLFCGWKLKKAGMQEVEEEQEHPRGALNG
jgi:hypothetical protein